MSTKKAAIERIAGYDVHPAASLFPLMGETELAELAGDIAARGQHDPVILHEGKVLDGRNRLTACELAGVQPKLVEWDGAGGSAVAFVLSKNLHRRHMTDSQRAMIAADFLPLFQEESRARRDAQLRRGSQPPAVSDSTDSPLAPRGANGKSVHKAAVVAGVGARSVERAKAVAEAAPAIADQVRAGAVTLKQAEKTIKRAAQVEAVSAYQPPTGRYSVIVADPPWQYEKRAGDATSRGHTPYPTSPGDEVVELVTSLIAPVADDDCILWLWITNAHLLEGLGHDILENLGFTGKTILTWVKPRMGVGDWLRGQTEHCILAVKGKPVIRPPTIFGTVLNAPTREHSRKPDEFYAMVQALCPAPAKLDLFAREARPGWAISGAEENKFDVQGEA
jgi:N6-adenosine-specific RNA methylase IME4/ParB-like chromosome segregation protein Spo0J